MIEPNHRHEKAATKAHTSHCRRTTRSKLNQKLRSKRTGEQQPPHQEQRHREPIKPLKKASKPEQNGKKKWFGLVERNKQRSPPPKLKTSKGEIPPPLETASERGKKHGDKEKPSQHHQSTGSTSCRRDLDVEGKRRVVKCREKADDLQVLDLKSCCVTLIIVVQIYNFVVVWEDVLVEVWCECFG